MNKLEKDFLLAWLLGMVLPAVILFTMVGGMGRGDNPAPGELSDPISVTISGSGAKIPVLFSDGTVEEMEPENYLCGVVLAEMPVDFEIEALKAQSVVARTYALRRLERGTKHTTGAVCTDPACCQGYLSQEDFLKRGGSPADISKVSRAVLETAGQVLLYDGKLIDATYFSCSGGMTEDAVAVWGNDVPYLQSVASPGEEIAVHHSDALTLLPEEVEKALGISLHGDPDEWFTILSLTDGGGVGEIRVCGAIYTGVELRKLLSLRSTSFTVSASADAIVFHTKGYGHRVGMSQYGAEAMALNGHPYDEILLHYYQGASLATYGGDD